MKNFVLIVSILLAGAGNLFAKECPEPELQTQDILTEFIKDKYVLRVYVDPDEDDPVTAYHNGKDSKKSKKKKPKRKRKDTEESEESEPEEAPAPPKKKTTTVKQPPVAQNRAPAASKKRGGAAVADMISFKGEDDFSEFMDGGTANTAASGSNLIGFEQ